MERLRLAGIGCGGRTLTYFDLAARMPDLYEVVAAADPLPGRVEEARKRSRNPAFRGFDSDKEILSVPKLADIMIIGTQDAHHFAPAKAAMEKGYDLLLEKPISPDPAEVLELERIASRLGRRVLVCHVLRYSPFYRKVKELVSSGAVGRVMCLNATEGVGDWHQCHSYVRGHWAVTEKSSPMILAKSCHDLDIISWLMDAACRSVASSGSLLHFTKANAPEGAPGRCTDGCPVGPTCPYNSLLYITKHRSWLEYVFDLEKEKRPSGGASDDEIRAWLSKSPWGRCVWRCDNTAVDHQVTEMEFAGGASASFTMTAWSAGRDIEIFGTKGILRGGEFVKRSSGSDIIVLHQDTGHEERHSVNPEIGGYEGHGGGDPGLMLSLHSEMMRERPEQMTSSIQRSVESHLMAFAAEKARVASRRILLQDLKTGD
jgi:predicted dehydrogenase